MWIMQCQPLHAAWDDRGSCMSRGAKEGIILAQAVISIVSDFSFAAFPILFLWRIQVDLKTKIGLWLLMGLGFITGACCLVRTVLNGQSIPLDGTYDGIVNWVWRLFEVQFGIIAACIPTLRPLYSWVIARTKRQGMTFDSNIKFVGNEPESWVEDKTRHASNERGSSTSRDKRDTMRDELVREGIVSTANRDTLLHSEDDTEQGKQSGHGQSDLTDDMNKYGINGSLV